MFRVDDARVSVLGGLLAEPWAAELLDAFEELDPQNAVIRRVCELSEPRAALRLIVGVSLLSYMLSAPGEAHWAFLLRLAESEAPISADKVPRILRRFLDESPSMRLFRAARARRLERILGMLVALGEPSEYSGDLRPLWLTIAKGMRADPDAKTVVFAVRMAYYVLKALGHDPRIPAEIPIPADFRVSLMSLASGIIRPLGEDLEASARRLRAKPGLVRRAWGLVCERAGLPPLRLDALLWVSAGMLRAVRYDPQAFVERASALPGLPREAPRLLRELVAALEGL